MEDLYSDEEDDEHRNREPGLDSQDGTQRGGNSLAATAMQPRRGHMTEHRSESGDLTGDLASEQAEDECREKSLENVDRTDKNCPARAEGTADIGGTGITRAHLSDIHSE